MRKVWEKCGSGPVVGSAQKQGLPQFLAPTGFTQAGDLGFEPKTLVFRWHSSRMAFTSQAIETTRVKRKPRFSVRMLRSHGQ
jgi:hypothetical protein